MARSTAPKLTPETCTPWSGTATVHAACTPPHRPVDPATNRKTNRKVVDSNELGNVKAGGVVRVFRPRAAKGQPENDGAHNVTQHLLDQQRRRVTRLRRFTLPQNANLVVLKGREGGKAEGKRGIDNVLGRPSRGGGGQPPAVRSDRLRHGSARRASTSNTTAGKQESVCDGRTCFQKVVWYATRETGPWSGCAAASRRSRSSAPAAADARKAACRGAPFDTCVQVLKCSSVSVF